MSRSFRPLALLVVWCLACSITWAAEPLRLSASGSVAEQPRIVASANGNVTVVWHESRLASPGAAPSESIVARERRDGQWLEPHVLAQAEAGATLGEPAVALDDTGAAYVVWVVTSLSGQRVDYAFRNGLVWAPAVTLGRSAALAIERPAVAVHPGDPSIFFTWQERRGSSQYRIRTVVLGPGGIAYSDTVAGRNPMAYVIYPELVVLPPEAPGGESRMALCWFDLGAGRARLDTRVWRPERHDWVPPATELTWSADALASLPLVAGSGELPPLLVGYYAPTGQGDRVFVATEDLGGLACLDASPECLNRAPRVGRPLGDRLSFVWRQETAGESRLMQGIVEPPKAVASLSLAAADPFSPPEADTALSALSVLCVWSTPTPNPDQPGRYLPTVLFQDTPVDDFTAWRALVPANAAASR